MPRGRPVAVTVEQRADDAAAQHSVESFLILLWLEFGDDFLAIGEAAYVKSFRVGWPTAKARQIRRVCFLDALISHDDRKPRINADNADQKNIKQTLQSSIPMVWLPQSAFIRENPRLIFF